MKNSIIITVINTPLFEIGVILRGMIPSIIWLRFGRRRRLAAEVDAPQISAIVAVPTACRAPRVGLLAATAVIAAGAAIAPRTPRYGGGLIEALVGGLGDALHVPG